MLDRYTAALIREIEKWGKAHTNSTVDTVYIGGGTPSLMGKRIKIVADSIRRNFSVSENAEFTVEINPDSSGTNFLKFAKESGINRVSVGVQSGDDCTLKALGRKHTAQQSVRVVETARALGFDNISVDLMIALPNSNLQTLKADIDFILSLTPKHISAYILKIENNTAFAKSYGNLNLPDDDQTAEQYLFMCECFENAGYEHYEISNFAKDCFRSRHNMKYWRGCDYLGIGPSAHSFVDGKRFFYERDLKGFINSASTTPDGTGGDSTEELMLRLRLKDGVDLSHIYKNIDAAVTKKLSVLQKSGYLNVDLPNVSLTDKGMLVSNSIITELLE